MYTRELSFQKVKDEVVSYIERCPGASPRSVPMDVGNQAEEDEGTFNAPAFQCWGGATDPHEMEHWRWRTGVWAIVGGTWGWEEPGLQELVPT